MRKRIVVSFFFFSLILSACAGAAPPEPEMALSIDVVDSLTPEPTHTLTNTETLQATASLSPTLTPTLPATTTPSPTPYGDFDPGVNPLTGLPVNDPTKLERRPVMVKVSNWPRSGRPHAGLTSADIVFEYFIGHQMNRFLAVYYGEDAAVIGPVRSGRLVDAQLVNFYQGILAYGDADPQVDEVLFDALGDRALAFLEVPCPPMCGEATHDATGVFTNSADLTEYAVSRGIDNSAPDLQGMFFQQEPLAGDADGKLLRVEYADFSIMQWHYDEGGENYHLWMEEEAAEGLDLAPMTDRNNDQLVIFDNLVVMYANYIEHTSTLHDIVLRDAADYQPVLFFRDGRMTYGTWRVSGPDRPILFETPEGNPLAFKPGKTWIVIVGMGSQTIRPSGGEWEIYFGLP
ncbi:MAG: DUF3048 domain-containing protein [Chloroflexota bacterium]|nr:DUF3048 domain-containing protein [Chloroflexota bacterium]